MAEAAMVLEPDGGDGGGDEPTITAVGAILLFAGILHRIRQRGPVFEKVVNRAIEAELKKK